MIQTGYIGTYASPKSHGIYHFFFDTETGGLSKPELFYEGRDMKCAAFSKGLLAAPVQRESTAGVVVLDTERQGRVVAEANFERETSCYLLMEDEYLYSANFHEGHVLVCRRNNGALELAHRVSFGGEAGCHQVLLWGQRLLVPCMNLDKVALLDRERDFAEAGSLCFPTGSGPRHGVFDRWGRWLYVVTQFSHEVYAFRVGDGEFRQEGAYPIFESTAPPGAETAAVRLSPDGRFLYVSTRGANVLTVFALSGGALTRLQQVSCGGDHPRDFVLSSDGRFLLVLNRDSDNLVSFQLDRESGLIGAAVSEAEIGRGSGIVLYE